VKHTLPTALVCEKLVYSSPDKVSCVRQPHRSQSLCQPLSIKQVSSCPAAVLNFLQLTWISGLSGAKNSLSPRASVHMWWLHHGIQRSCIPRDLHVSVSGKDEIELTEYPWTPVVAHRLGSCSLLTGVIPGMRTERLTRTRLRQHCCGRSVHGYCDIQVCSLRAMP